MEIFIYLLKVNLYCTLFYACYWVLLRRHTFFNLNRMYLVGTLFLSWVLPFIEFTETIRIPPTETQALPSQAVYVPIDSGSFQINWELPVLMIYGIGVLYMLFNLQLGLRRLYALLEQGERIKFDAYTLILLPKNTNVKTPGSFSFFKYLVISGHDYENHFDTILRHEYVHIKQRHSFDILFIEVLKSACWYNPVFWFYKYSLLEVHEYLADQQAESKSTYANFLVSYAQNWTNGTIANNFFNSFLLKDRIKMLYSKSTSYWLLSKYFLIIPMIAFTVLKTGAHHQVLVVEPTQIGHIPVPLKDFSKPGKADTLVNKNKKRRQKPTTYNAISSNNQRSQGDSSVNKYFNFEQEYVQRISLHRDSLWEVYNPKITQISYYNKAKIRRIKPFPNIQGYGEQFGKSMDLSAKDAPKTVLHPFSLSVAGFIEFPPNNIKKVVE